MPVGYSLYTVRDLPILITRAIRDHGRPPSVRGTSTPVAASVQMTCCSTRRLRDGRLTRFVLRTAGPTFLCESFQMCFQCFTPFLHTPCRAIRASSSQEIQGVARRVPAFRRWILKKNEKKNVFIQTLLYKVFYNYFTNVIPAKWRPWRETHTRSRSQKFSGMSCETTTIYLRIVSFISSGIRGRCLKTSASRCPHRIKPHGLKSEEKRGHATSSHKEIKLLTFLKRASITNPHCSPDHDIATYENLID